MLSILLTYGTSLTLITVPAFVDGLTKVTLMSLLCHSIDAVLKFVGGSVFTGIKGSGVISAMSE